MSCSLGISTGSSGVYSAFVDTDSASAVPGRLTAEVRFVSADQVHTNVGDLVRASIKLMTTQVSDRAGAPRSIGVTFRTNEQLASIRSALSRSSDLVRLIPEPAAVHAYLSETGKVERYSTTAHIDLGDHGLAVSIVDHSGEVLAAERTDVLTGAGIDRALVDFVTETAAQHLGRYADAALLVSRCHVAKEQLSTMRSVTVDLPLKPIMVTRTQFEDIIAPDIARAVTFIRGVLADAPRTVEAVVLIGGGAHIPVVTSAIADAVDLPIVELDEPEAAAAKGAALLADSVTSLRYALSAPDSTERTGTAVRASGALIGALVVGGLVFGYGAKELVPTDDTPISPAGTGSTTSRTTSEISPSVGSTLIPSNDPLPSAAVQADPTYRYPLTQRYPTHQYTLPPAPLPDTSRPTATLPETSTATTDPTTTAPPTTVPTTVPTTTQTTPPTWPTIPGITLPDPPAWWPQPGANAPIAPPEQSPGNDKTPAGEDTTAPTTATTPAAAPPSGTDRELTPAG
ncbi:hypothetical protein B2J88_26595 [Rhodococcus sp. SRB_17]|nr:hypothetical protein [Rhodococcus sp. SRB_17]